MAFTLAFHIILVPLGVSWSVMTLIDNYRGIKRNDPDAMLLAQRCNTNACPVGVTTQNPKLQRGLVVPDKAERVYAYHKNTVHAVAEFVAAMGLEHPSQLAPHHVFKRINAMQVASLDEIYQFLKPGQFLDGTGPERLQRYWNESTSAQFQFDPRQFDAEPHLYVRQFTDLRSAT